jgi:transcriptional regulator with XRE-family HTH domain
MVTEKSAFFAELRQRAREDPAYLTERALLEVAERVYVAMEEQGVSRAELARRVGVPRQRVTNFLNTPSNTTVQTIVRFAQALGLEVDISLRPREAVAAPPSAEVARAA